MYTKCTKNEQNAQNVHKTYTKCTKNVQNV